MSNNSPPSAGLRIQGIKTVPPLSVYLDIGSEIKSLSDLMRNMEFTSNGGANEYFVTYVVRKKQELKKLLNPKVIEILELLKDIKDEETNQTNQTNQKKVYYIDSLKKIILKKIQELCDINIFKDLVNLKLYDDYINNSLREVLSIIINYTPIDRTVSPVKVSPVMVSPTTVITTTVQPTFPAVRIDTIPIKQPDPSEKLRPNKIKSWFASMREITLTRASLLKQKSKKVFNNKNVRRGFMGLVASLALASDVSLLNKNEHTDQKISTSSPSSNPVNVTQDGVEYNINSTPEALGVALKVAEARLLKAEEYRKKIENGLLIKAEEEFKKLLKIKISLPPLPVLDTDYQISFENKKELFVPAGSNVWRVVESDLKKQVSNFESLNKKSRDTMIANVIKSISAQHSTNNLSMIKAGQPFNMPNIILKNK